MPVFKSNFFSLFVRSYSAACGASYSSSLKDVTTVISSYMGRAAGRPQDAAVLSLNWTGWTFSWPNQFRERKTTSRYRHRWMIPENSKKSIREAVYVSTGSLEYIWVPSKKFEYPVRDLHVSHPKWSTPQHFMPIKGYLASSSKGNINLIISGTINASFARPRWQY